MPAEARHRESALIPHAGIFGYQCLRSLNKRGIHTILGIGGGNCTQAASRYCDETVDLPDPGPDLRGYADALLRIASRPDVRTVLPVWEEDSYVLSKYRDEFEAHVDVVVPSFESLRTVHDRMLLVEAAEKAGVPVPETRLLTDVEDWNSESIVKSRYNLVTSDYVDSYPANEAETVNGVTHLRPSESPDCDEIRREMKHVPIVQEFVPRANEYMVGAICDHGKPLATVQLHQIREDSYVGGGGVYRESVYLPELDDVARNLLEELDWHGLACIEYLEDAETGEFKLAEINPRTWQSLPTTVRAGGDFPYYYWLQATDRVDEIDPDYEVGVGSHYIRGELNHVLSVLRDDSPYVERPKLTETLYDVLVTVYEQPHFDVLRLDDPEPFARSVLGGLNHRLESLR